MSNAVVPMQDVMKMAEAVAKSGLFGVKSADQALALMLVAQAEGRHPALAARDYDIIQGRPAKKTEAMLRDFLESGGKVEWHELSDVIADATFSHPSGGSVRIAWDMKRAGAAGLSSRDMWRKYPRQMLRSRTVSEGIRTVCPMATSGMYVPEEVQDIVREKDITPAGGAEDRVSADRMPLLDKVEADVKEWLDKGSVADAVVVLDDNDFDADEKVALWKRFDSKQRSAMKKEMAAQKSARDNTALPPPTTNAAPPPPPPVETGTSSGQSTAAGAAPITAAQHKRLEARIKELGADRDKLKTYVKATYGIEHLDKLTKDAYKAVDAMLDKKAAAKTETAQPTLSERIKACATVEELDALADTLTEDDVGIYYDTIAKRKAELQEAQV